LRSPVREDYGWLVVEEVGSTQTLAEHCLREDLPHGAVLAHHQSAGKGRFGRVWISQRGDSLTMSLIFRDYADHPRPYLVGMAVAIAAAGSLHCQLRWPNDLVIGDRKLGGILTELFRDQAGRTVPVVGVGVNLNLTAFPDEIADRATSLALAHGKTYEAKEVAKGILARLERLPEPESWNDLAPIWALFDHTPGKHYRLASGEEAVALGIGSDGQLLCSVDGESRSVLAAEALFG
jgi:BirA family biotin operon repressor/biotin-[acetyl-CoA-carboxylase] ligase